MEEIRKQLQLERELFAREQAEWSQALAERKTRETLLLEEQRREAERIRLEQARAEIAGFEHQKGLLQGEVADLVSKLNLVNAEIAAKRGEAGPGASQWIIDERASLGAWRS